MVYALWDYAQLRMLSGKYWSETIYGRRWEEGIKLAGKVRSYVVNSEGDIQFRQTLGNIESNKERNPAVLFSGLHFFFKHGSEGSCACNEFPTR